MKILYDHQQFCQQRFGGVTRYFVELCKAMRRLGEDASIFCPLYTSHYLRAEPEIRGRGIWVPGGRYTRELYLSLNSAFASFQFPRLHGVDVVHETYYNGGIAIPPASTRAITLFDMIHETYPGYFSPSDPTPGLKRTRVLGADVVLCISEATRNDAIRIIGVDPARTRVTHLGIGSEWMRASDACATSGTHILFVGGRGRYKNFDRFLQAYKNSGAASRAVPLLCFGGGQPTDLERSRIGELGLSSLVSWREGSDDDLRDAYRAALMFVFPSEMEGFGLPLLEAMASGCPVACSQIPAFVEVAGDGANYFDPADVDDMTHALNALERGEGERQRLAALGLVRAKHFTWDRCARATTAAYLDFVR